MMLIICPTNVQFKIAIFKIYLSHLDEKFWKNIYIGKWFNSKAKIFRLFS